MGRKCLSTKMCWTDALDRQALACLSKLGARMGRIPEERFSGINNSALYALESRPFMRGRLDDAVEIGRWGCEGAPDPPAVEGEVEEADF